MSEFKRITMKFVFLLLKKMSSSEEIKECQIMLILHLMPMHLLNVIWDLDRFHIVC